MIDSINLNRGNIMEVQLNANEQELFNDIKGMYSFNIKGRIPYQHELEDVATHARTLYMSLNARGIPIRYDKATYWNRVDDVRCSPESVEFHEHPRIIEELINYVEQPNSFLRGMYGSP